MTIRQTKLIANGYKYPATITTQGERLYFKFGYNKTLIEEMKMMQGAKWDPASKQWSIADSTRNHFQLAFLEGQNPYHVYDRELIPFNFRRNPNEWPGFIAMSHQPTMASHVITRQYLILAAEMGTGKTITMIESMEWLWANRGIGSWIYVAPKSALTAVRLEFEKWKSLIQPQFLTYDAMRQVVENWPAGAKPPQGVIFDEASKVKTPNSKRSMAAKQIAHAIRAEWGEKGAVILMTGTPAPKSPLDWWNLAEIACPGFLREGTWEKLRNTLAIMSEGQNDSGQVFAKIVAWKDDERKCVKCGKFEDDPDHDSVNMLEKWFHAFQPSTNEVARLHRRLKGLVHTVFKKQCLDLPEKQYRIIHCKPMESILNAAQLLASRGDSVIRTMTFLRELSDGFQYQETDIGYKECPLCNGNKTRMDWEYVGPEDKYEEIMDRQYMGQEVPREYFQEVQRPCTYCSGTGQVTNYMREAVQVPTPKEAILNDLIEEHEDIGRLVVYAGFTGSVDRCTQIFLKAGWDVIRVDGRGWWSNKPDNAMNLLKRFQDKSRAHPKIGFVGQPGAAGMGLTLTESPTVVYYSNDFNGESRTQSEDRIHRPGMDSNRGATIIDIIHLPTDELVLNNLKAKRRLELMSLGELQTELRRS